MNDSLAGKTAVITGSASGIGKGIANEFLNEGASVLLVDINEEKLIETVSELKGEQMHNDVDYLAVNLKNLKNMNTIVETAISKFNKFSILVNCAGVYPSTSALTISEEEWDNVYELNVKSTFFLSQAAAKQMVKQGNGGSIINITSTASEVARPGVAHYCSSKAAVKMMTQVLALEWAKYGIRINALGPGLVETETLLQTLTTEAARREHEEKLTYSPMNRPALVEEIAKGVLYFATNQSSYVTGQTLLVDGGYSAGRFFNTSLVEEEAAR
ncbi:SDR family oxidoreductase [Fictibacillus sp. WQ 8-8]|uniref:SDR family NAD(P)-dependent oxidoreductase n=1 Tax=Fictibacillus sp. WQ 8-8 TaxID=2938788 RepID=UPI002108FCCA|nr:SDR family oxidoreductase [Fictibacillus sp. WQ 8-8]MCQ6268367.1 SDR family oxidoreductase [Fictibacillus sp. WQ 8-8]